jgi:hypothetical protein
MVSPSELAFAFVNWMLKTPADTLANNNTTNIPETILFNHASSKP